MVEILIVGAGIVGASAAYHLARGGARVTILEARRPAAGTTSRSFAWANANDKPPRAYHDLNQAGLVEHRRVLREFGPGGFHPTGNLELASYPEHQAELRGRVERLRAWGYAAETVSSGRARELAPEVSVPDNADATFFPEEGWVAAPILVGQFLAASAKLGARCVYPAPVTALLVEGGRVRGARTGAVHYHADVVVDCSGPAAGKLLGSLGLELARARAPGVLVVSETLPALLDRAVHANGVYLRPDGGGRVLFGSTEVDAMLPADLQPGEDLAFDSAPVRELHRRGAAVMPILGDARIDAVRVGWRPMPPDGYSAVGPISGLSGYYLIFTHSGVTLGPLLGKLAADEIMGGERRPELVGFRPDRLRVAAGGAGTA